MSYHALKSYREYPADQWDGLLRPAIDVKPTAADLWKAFQSCLRTGTAEGISFTFGGKRRFLDFEEFYTDHVESYGLPCSLEGFYGLADQHVAYLAACGEFFDSEKENAKYAACTGSAVADAFCNDPAQGENGIPPTFFEVYDSEKACLTDRFRSFMADFMSSRAQKAEETKPRAKLKPRKAVQEFVYPNNKLAKKALEAPLEAFLDGFGVSVNSSTVTPVQLINYDSEAITVANGHRYVFDRFDRLVSDAVTSIYKSTVWTEEGIFFTPDQVWRVITGETKSKRGIKDEQYNAVVRSIEKLRSLQIQIDLTQEAKLYKKKIDSLYLNETVLNLTGYILETGGHVMHGYRINSKPLFCKYAEHSNQIGRVDMKYLAASEVDANGQITEKRLPNTLRNLLTRDYLMRRIEDMRRDTKNKLTNVIALFSYSDHGKWYKGLYEALDFGVKAQEDLNDVQKRKACKAVRDYCEKVLKYWIATGYIRGYEFIKDGQFIARLRIDV